MSSQPDTNATVGALLAYLQALTFGDGITPVFPPITLPDGSTEQGVQKGQFRDYIAEHTANGKACCEVYGNLDDSMRHNYGGEVRDTQTFFVLALVSEDNESSGWTAIWQVRDAMVQVVQLHVALGDAANIISSRYRPNTGKYLRVPRDVGRFYLAYLSEVEITSQWQTPANYAQ